MKRVVYICVVLCNTMIISSCAKAKGPYFDTEKLRREGEIILNGIPGWKVKLKTQRRVEQDRHFDADEEKLAEQIIYYSFLDEDDGGFTVEEIQFGNEMVAQMAFSSLQKRSKNGDETPGLTYTNDFLLKKSTSIFWLNTPCSY